MRKKIFILFIIVTLIFNSVCVPSRAEGLLPAFTVSTVLPTFTSATAVPLVAVAIETAILAYGIEAENISYSEILDFVTNLPSTMLEELYGGFELTKEGYLILADDIKDLFSSVVSDVIPTGIKPDIDKHLNVDGTFNAYKLPDETVYPRNGNSSWQPDLYIKNNWIIDDNIGNWLATYKLTNAGSKTGYYMCFFTYAKNARDRLYDALGFGIGQYNDYLYTMQLARFRSDGSEYVITNDTFGNSTTSDPAGSIVGDSFLNIYHFDTYQDLLDSGFTIPEGAFPDRTQSSYWQSWGKWSAYDFGVFKAIIDYYFANNEGADISPITDALSGMGNNTGMRLNPDILPNSNVDVKNISASDYLNGLSDFLNGLGLSINGKEYNVNEQDVKPDSSIVEKKPSESISENGVIGFPALITKFPFCVINDVHRFLNVFIGNPQAPVLKWDFGYSELNITEGNDVITFDFEEWDDAFFFLRLGLQVLFLWYLVKVTYDKLTSP